MALELVDLVGLAAKEVGESFSTATGVVGGYYRDAFEALPDGPPVISIARGVAQQACRRYADNPDGMPGAVAAGFESACRPYLDSIGYGAPPTVKLPFRGGQCYGVQYRVTTAFNNPPIGPQTNEQVVTSRVVGTFRGNKQPNQLTPVGIELQQVEGGAINRVTIASLADENLGSFRIQSVVREGGGIDGCGNPPPTFTDPVPPPSPGPQVEPFNPSPGIDIDIDLTIGPTGGITFNIGTGPITIDPFPDIPGGGGGNDNPGIDQPGTAPSSGLPPGDIGAPAAPVDTGEDGIAAGCAPPNSVLVGIKIDILEVTGPVSEYDPLVRRGVCYAYMGTPGNLALEPSGVALRSGQMLFAPLDNLTCYEVRANVGFSLRVTPYYRALELTEV